MYQSPPTGVPIDPIISRLRPRTVTEVLDHAFRLYRKHFLAFVAIIAVVYAPLQLLIQGGAAFLLGDILAIQDEVQFGDISQTRANEILTFYLVVLGALGGVSLIGGLIAKLSEGALTAAVAASHLDRPVTFGSAYSQMLRQIGSLLGLILLELLIRLAIFVPIILLFFLAFGFALADSTGDIGLGIVCLGCFLFIPALAGLIYVTVRLTVTTPALIVEKLGPMQAIRRSWVLVSTYWWRTLALQAVLWVLNLVVQQGPGTLVSTIVSAFAPQDIVLQQLLSGFVITLTTLIYVPLQLIAITLYYFDLRVRKEGYDLETAMSQRYSPSTPPPAWGDHPGGYAQPQYGQTQPTGGYTPPQLGTETQPQPYNPPYEQPYSQSYGEHSPPPSPTRPISETPNPNDPQEQS
jgi:hypothetical protein